jgi:outer membrane lipoprotein
MKIPGGFHMQHSFRNVAIVAWALIAISCAANLSREARSQVTYEGDFLSLRQQPQQHVGEVVMLGGRIIENQVTEGRTDLVVLQLALTTSNQPTEEDRSEGRFIVRADQFLDPALYPPGTPITVIGRISGSEKRSIGQMTYEYPLVEMIEIRKWPQGQRNPRVHFGFGVGTVF